MAGTKSSKPLSRVKGFAGKTIKLGDPVGRLATTGKVAGCPDGKNVILKNSAGEITVPAIEIVRLPAKAKQPAS